MMEPQPAIKFADAEKVPRVVLPGIRWIHLFEEIAENVCSHLAQER
ncbi:MAG: hypothetical protein WBW99_15840 [Pseudolabrys sp.]